MKGYLYAMTNPLQPGWTKVGRTDNVNRRSRDLASSAGVPVQRLDVEWVMPVEDTVTAELRLHHWLSNAGFLRAEGTEWFACSAEDVAEVWVGTPLPVASPVIRSDGVPARSPEAVGRIVKAERKRIGLTQSELAEWVPCNRYEVIQLESGRETKAIRLMWDMLAGLGLEFVVRPRKAVDRDSEGC